MTNPRRDWDRDEREALEGLQDQLDTMRRRHENDPSFELLRAAHEGALPDDLQGDVAQHIADGRLSQALVDDLGDDGPSLTRDESERLLARIERDARAEATPARGRSWWRPLVLASGFAAVALAWVVTTRTPDAPGAATGTRAVTESPAEAPPLLLAFDKPEVRLGLAALTWRGPSQTNQLLADLKPGLDAFRQGDYATADRELTALAGRYPGTIEILFYQGVSRLFLNDLPGAVSALAAAEAVGDPAFADDVAWYRAVAEQRAGNLTDARNRLDALCGARRERSGGACAALKQLGQVALPSQR